MFSVHRSYSSHSVEHNAYVDTRCSATRNLADCNSPLNGITANEIGRIQKVQNTAARLILKRDRGSSATVMLNDLHWLSMKKRVMYRISILVYKYLHSTSPDYITARLNE